MVAERLGLIRIYNLESLKPIYTLLCMSTFETELLNTCLLSMDWCQSSPEIVVASTSTDIILWNTYKSRYKSIFIYVYFVYLRSL
jgi:hypothetical protein